LDSTVKNPWHLDALQRFVVIWNVLAPALLTVHALGVAAVLEQTHTLLNWALPPV